MSAAHLGVALGVELTTMHMKVSSARIVYISTVAHACKHVGPPVHEASERNTAALTVCFVHFSVPQAVSITMLVCLCLYWGAEAVTLACLQP